MLKIPDDLEEKLRYIAVRKFGFRKACFKQAVIEALRECIENNSRILAMGERRSVEDEYEGGNV